MKVKIISTPGILGGKPIIAGTRVSVELVLDLLANDWSATKILQEYPHLTKDAVQAAIVYAANRVSGEKILPIRNTDGTLEFPLSL